jgi:hypothetical protein
MIPTASLKCGDSSPAFFFPGVRRSIAASAEANQAAFQNGDCRAAVQSALTVYLVDTTLRCPGESSDFRQEN